MNLSALKTSLPAADSQHGFRSQRSATSALLPLANRVASGFNTKKPATRTGLLCVDLSKAFDVVNHHKLVEQIGQTDLHPNLKRWLVAYLRDRKVRCLYQGKSSKWKKLKMGVPQGSVISPVVVVVIIVVFVVVSGGGGGGGGVGGVFDMVITFDNFRANDNANLRSSQMKPCHLSLSTTPAAADVVADSQVKYHMSQADLICATY